MSPHCHLTRKMPLLDRHRVNREQRDILGLVLDGSSRNSDWDLLGRDSPERKQREVLGLVGID